MKINLDCIPCFLRQALDAVRLVTDDESIHEQIVRDVLKMAREMDLDQTPPAIGREIHQRIRELTNNSDPYRQLKQQHNRLALSLYDLLEPAIHSSEHPLEYAVRLAIAGNIIDLGTQSSISEKEIQKNINESLIAPIDDSMIDALQTDIDNAQTILYLADNAGEIVFDRLLIEQLPMKKITVAVRGLPIINDATMDDAIATGLTQIVNVIDNGSDAPGTLLETCSEEFVSCFEQSDLIIAKGQGNFETLSDLNKDIYFILKAKCPLIASHLNQPMGAFVLKRNRVVTNVR